MQSQADRAAYALLFATMELGYYISQPKSTLRPVQRMVHLGLGIDSTRMAYFLTDRIRQKFRLRREELLGSGSCNEKQMQSFVGKCNHLRSVFAASSLFTFHSRKFISSLSDVQTPLPPNVIDELNFWSFVDSQTEPVPFRFHQHLRLRLFTDASGFAYGAEVLLPSGPLVLRDYWRSELLSRDICVKEALAVLFALQALPESVERRRVDISVDNEALFHSWSGLKASSQDLVEVLRELFLFCVDLNVDLRLHWVPSASNPADAPSRVLSHGDCALAPALRLKVWNWGGPFHFDLMALPSNVFQIPGHSPLPFFSPFPVAGSAGVDLFSQQLPQGRLWCFPPHVMIRAVIGLLDEVGGRWVALILPVGPAFVSWLPRLSPFIVKELPLASSSEKGVVLFPSRSGFSLNRYPLGFGLTAYLCFFPPRPSISAPLPPPSVRVLMVADSMFRPISSLIWPRPFAVKVVCMSGGKLRSVLLRLFYFLSLSHFDICLFHGGVNDVSKSGDDFESAFRETCSFAAAGFPSRFPRGSVFCSSVCQTRSSALNLKVCQANTILRSFSAANGWRFISNDNIHFPDLSDEVHLNAAGVAKLYRHISSALRLYERGGEVSV